MKGEYITISVFAIILAVSLLLIMIYREELFKKKQADKKNSLLEGYGFYSDPITLPCTNNTGKCTEPSTQKTIFRCIPHPSTGKGCIDNKGHMSYDNKVVEKPCQQQCLGSLFTVNDAVDYKNIDINGKENQLLQGIGCNKVVNTINGFDESDFFIGEFNTNTLKYKLKNCIPENYQGYYTKTYTCNNYDTTGANNCRYTCGQDGSIKINGLFDTKLSKNVLMYYPTEFDQEGVKRHVCYDINDVNQIEILNSVTEVPNDFYYPNICYKHVNEYNISNLLDLYPAGYKNVVTSNLNYNTIQEKFFFDNSFNTLLQNLPTLITSNYDYYYDYENYIKLLLNNETMLVSKINANIDSTFIDTNFINDIILMYINTGNNNLASNISNLYFKNNTGTNITLNFYADEFYQVDNVANNVKNINQYIPFNIVPMLDNEQGPVEISFGLSTSTIGDPNNILSNGDLIYYRSESNNYNNGKLLKILEKGTSTALVDNIILNDIEKIYWRKLNAKIVDNDLLFTVVRKSDNNLINLSINYNTFLLTNNIFLKNGQNYNNDNELLLTRNIETLTYYDNDSFFLFDQEVQKPGVRSSNYGFFYPLYLKTFNYATTISNQGTNIFTTTVTSINNRSDKVLLNDIQNNAFFITDTSTGIPLYYYPVYLVNNTYTNTITFTEYEGSIFYLPSDANQAVSNKPEGYLNYLDFNQYAAVAMVYKDGNDYKYPVFLSKNFANTHSHNFVNYKDITFYMPDSNNNHALSEPPKRDYKLTDFKDLFEIGSVNVNLNNYNLTNLTFTVPNNAQLNQQIHLPNFDPMYINKDIQLYQNGTSIANIIYTTKNQSGNIISVFRENDFLLNNLSGDSIFTQKSRLYNQILSSQAKKRINDNTVYDTVINPEKKLLISADFKLFQSPYIENEDGTTTNICYDEYNKPLANGTQVTLNSPSKGGSKNNTIVINVPCSNFNTDVGASCGVLGLSIGAQPCQQERESMNYLVKENTEVLNPSGDYLNEFGYMENGLDIVENKMVCLNNYRDPYDPKDGTKCFPPYFTREKEDKNYAPEEELYLTRYKRDYYLSTNNNNSEYPLNPLFWDRIFVPTPDSEVSNYQTFFYKSNQNNYIFRTNQSGVTGLEPNQLAIQPVFRKNIAPYHNYEEFNPGSSWWDNHNQLAKNLNPSTKNIFLYNNIEITPGGNNIASLVNPDNNTIVNQVFNITYQDETIKNLDLEIGDIFQTGFTFFNSILYFIAKSYAGLDVNIINTFGANFSVTNGNYNFYNFNTTQINCDYINTKLKVGDYLLIIPYKFGNNDQILTEFNNFQSIVIDENTRNIFNPCFEIILITNINGNNLTVERNILNLNNDNYFYIENNQNSTIEYRAIPIKDSLIDLNFPITNIVNDKLSFEITFNLGYELAKFFENNPEINLINTGVLALTPFISANYIKKSVTVPNQPFGTNNEKLYLASMPGIAKTISALLDLHTEVIDSVTYLYINEFRSTRYTTNDNFKTSFQIGDIIDLEFDTGSKLTLRVIRTNIFFKNNIYDKRYDYYCSILEGDASHINTNNLSNYTFTNGEYYLAYYYYGSSNYSIDDFWWPNITILKTPRPGFENSMTITIYDTNNGIKISDIDISSLQGIGFFPLDNTNFINKIPIEDNNKYLTQSKILSEANSVAYLRLSATTFTSEKGTISIDNIKTIGKPEGVIYYPNVNINNNTPDRVGFGYITSFQLNNINVSSSIIEGDEFISKHNYILRATNKNIAGYEYIDGAITSQNTILNYDDSKIYSEKQIVDYINPNQRIYYRNVTGESTTFNQNTWQARAESIYTESSVIDFAFQESYLKDTIVRYEGKLWKATRNLFSGTSVPSSTSGWQEVTLTELDLYSNQSNFFTFTNQETEISNNQLNEFNEENINNYPLCISDYSNQTNYCPQPSVKFTESAPDFSNSFITVLPGASSLASIMGQAFLTNNGDDYLSLPAVPYSAQNYKRAQYLKDSGDIASADNLAQYLYQIPILNGLDEGKPYCINNWLDTGVSDITFANSIVFFMLPLDINSQDYPVFDVSQNGLILTKNNFSSRNNTFFGMSIISYKNNDPVLIDIGTSDATYIINEYDNKFSSGETILLTKIGGGSSVNVTINKQGYYPINQARINNEGSGYKLGDIWYYTDSQNEILAHGYLQPVNSGGSINAGSFFSYYTDFNQNRYNTSGLTIISQNGTGFDYNWNDNKWTEIIDYTISEPQNFTAGTYRASQDDILEIYIADNGQGEPLQYNQYLIGTSTPTDQLTDGVSAYQIFNQDSFKCRMYGLFGSDYLSNISYRLDSNLINNLNQENPGLLFNNFTTNIFSNSAISVGVVSENVNSPEYITDIYDVFNIKSNDGTSSNISLLTNNYSMPAINNKTKPLPLAYNNGQLREFNVVNTTDLHDFFSVPYSNMSNIYMGAVNVVLPVLKPEPSNEVIKFSTIRQSRGRQNIGTSFDCNFYFKPQNITTATFPSGGEYILSYSNDNFYYNFDNNSAILDNNNGLNFKSNLEYFFDLTNTSLDNLPLAFSTANGKNFQSNIIKSESTIIANGTLNIFYYINNAQIDYNNYINTTFYKQTNARRSIKIYYDTGLENMTNAITIYMGFNNFYNNNLIISNNQ